MQGYKLPVTWSLFPFGCCCKMPIFSLNETKICWNWRMPGTSYLFKSHPASKYRLPSNPLTPGPSCPHW